MTDTPQIINSTPILCTLYCQYFSFTSLSVCYTHTLLLLLLGWWICQYIIISAYMTDTPQIINSTPILCTLYCQYFSFTSLSVCYTHTLLLLLLGWWICEISESCDRAFQYVALSQHIKQQIVFFVTHVQGSQRSNILSKRQAGLWCNVLRQ